jgi:membrane protease subunit HflC
MKPIYLILAFICFLLLNGSMFILDQREQALVVQFGQPMRVVREPGLHFKIPFAQDLIVFDKRVLDLNADPKELIAADQKRLIVDSFAKYRIVDPLKFYQTVRNEAGMRVRLNAILDSRLREVLGSVPLQALLTGEREKIMQDIKQKVNQEAKSFGIDVVDVRIMRADLPPTNSEAIFLRMQTERQREAKEFRAQGAEESQRIRSRADKERTIILAEAQKQSSLLRGAGEGKSTEIYTEAYSRDPEFYRFYRTLQAYRETLKNTDTTLILSQDSEFLKFFNDLTGK